MDVFPVDWQAGDVVESEDDEGTFEIAAFGKTPDGLTACVRIRFHPYFFVRVPDHWSAPATKLWILQAVKEHGCVPEFCVPVRRKSVWGYSAAAQHLVQLAFPSAAAARRARHRLARTQGGTYEASVDPVARLCHLRGLSPAGWLRVTGGQQVSHALRRSRCDVETRVFFLNVGPSPPEVAALRPPLVLASWDIECYSASGRFPLASNPDDTLVCIGTSFQRYGEASPYLRSVVTLDTCDPVPGVEVLPAGTEADVFAEWCRLLAAHKVDVLLSYNGNQFDWKYLAGRAAVSSDRRDEPFATELLGRAADSQGTNGEPREWELNSGAYGQNAFFALATPGVLQLDLLHYLRREVKLDSYSLNAVADKFLGDRKLDLPAAEIFARFKGSAADRAVIAEYCAKDTELPLRLLAKLAGNFVSCVHVRRVAGSGAGCDRGGAGRACAGMVRAPVRAGPAARAAAAGTLTV